MVTSRALRALALSLCLVSIHTGTARSQGSAQAGSATPGAEPGADDDDGAAGGSATTRVAPADPRLRGAWLTSQLDAAIAARAQLSASARVGVTVFDLAEGKELYAHDAGAPMSLASNAKLLTATAALATLGGGFRWRTAVFVEDKGLDERTGVVDGDLYVRGRGDPTLAASDLRELATEIAARGIRTVRGQLIVDATYFDGEVEPPHFAEQPKERAAFRAPVASFGVSRGAFVVHAIGAPGGGAKVWLEPDAGDHVKLARVEVASVRVGRTRIKITTRPANDRLEVEVVGQLRLADGHWSARRRVDDPQRFAAEVFRALLAEQGVKVQRRQIGAGPVPASAQLVASHDSAPLAAVIRDMNKASDNYVAETVLKTLGAETRATPGPATWGDGQTALQTALDKLGLPPGSYRAANGSGLFGSTGMSARQLVSVLRAAHADYRIGPDLVASLPVGGQDGTLARRWHGSIARGRVRAKTGTLASVTTLAGYVGVDSGRPLAFAVLVNDIPTGLKGQARALADDMLDAIVAYLDAAGPARAP